MDSSKTAQEALQGAPVSTSHSPQGEVLETSLRAVEEVLGAIREDSRSSWDESLWDLPERRGLPVRVRLAKADLSPGTKYRLEQAERKREARRNRAEHYKIRRARRRAKYWAYERPGKLRRDKWLSTCPEGLFLAYRRLAKKKKRLWDISHEDFVAIMNTKTPTGVEVYRTLFDIVLKDKSLGYTKSNINILDRYTRAMYY